MVVTGIYSGPGEKQDPEVSPGFITQAVEEAGHGCAFKIEDMEEAATLAARLCKGDTVLITLGAGDIWRTHDVLIKQLSDLSNQFSGSFVQWIRKYRGMASLLLPGV